MAQENLEAVQKGSRLLLEVMAPYIGMRMRQMYKNNWWDEVLRALNDPFELPGDGTYAELVDSLDTAACLKLIDRRWNEVFRDRMPQESRAWVNELKAVRNATAHRGMQDIDRHAAERALDTMALLCSAMDKGAEEGIRELYLAVRAKTEGKREAAAPAIVGIEQPWSDSVRGELKEGSLLQMVGTPVVEKTALTRKVNFGGRTVIYPVYRVRPDALYYNDQNDRIATWITRYEAENGEGSLSGLDREIYNMVIENFIVDSNPDAIRKTQRNIALVGQREPGVALADGRVVDGNRRLTCLRRLQRTSAEPLWFETVLMDMDIREDRKQIKLLELAVQHGEEKKVDYDQIDYAVGTYRDIEETKLLTVEEYAQGANESPADVRKRLEIAGLINEFLNASGVSGQYHVAREYQIYNLLYEMTPLLKQLSREEQAQLKEFAFRNTVLGAVPDQRKFIRDLKTLIRSGDYRGLFSAQTEQEKRYRERMGEYEIRGKEDLDRFAAENRALADEMRDSVEEALLRSRSRQIKAKPGEIISKCVTLMMDVDARLFSRLDADDRDALRAQLDELSRITDTFRDQL